MRDRSTGAIAECHRLSRARGTEPDALVATFSIVAYDAATHAWGVAVQSRFLAVGNIVPWAAAGAGVIATQALTNVRFGPVGLAMLQHGMSAVDAVAGLVASDADREYRQIGVVDRDGRAAAFTGTACFPWAGHVVGEGFACQGNMLANDAVVRAMASSFEREATVAFPERLIAVLRAGQANGGDVRGQQAAALLVVRAGAGYGGQSDRVVDLRVDDHPAPIDELARLLALHREIFP